MERIYYRHHFAKKTKAKNGFCVPSVVSLWHKNYDINIETDPDIE